MDPNELLARAERAYRDQQWEEARKCLAQAERSVGHHQAISHLLALVEKQAGRLEEADRAFSRAIALAPYDADICNNYANFLKSRGENDAALALFSRALVGSPANHAVRINRAVLLKEMGRFEDALEEIEHVVAHEPRNVRALSAKGSILHALGSIAEAGRAYDMALALEPSRPIAIHGRARVALERGDPSAAAYYEQALKSDPGNRELVLGLARALASEGNPAGQELLESTVRQGDIWLEGIEELARMRHEAGQADFAGCYEDALKRSPGDEATNLSYWEVLRGADRAHQALEAIDRARPHLSPTAATLLAEAVIASEAGDQPRARKALASVDALPEAAVASARLTFQEGQPERAAARLEAAVAHDPTDIGAWAYLGLAWRLLGDGRFDWLCMQDGLVQFHDLPFEDGFIDRLGALLRGLHRTRSYPVGQSLRGGTQTRGRLFWRDDPELIELSRVVEDILQAYRDALPPVDVSHPLLRHRARSWQLGGSWSVRLTHGGFHVSHIHPQGVLSSAFYVSLPDTLDGPERSGWLELGRPPAQLGLDLEPLAMIEPKPGRVSLFPSYFFHGTRPFNRGERLTIAFDVEAG